MTKQSGNTTKTNRTKSIEDNPDPIRDEEDLAEFGRLLAEEKLKKLTTRDEPSNQ